MVVGAVLGIGLTVLNSIYTTFSVGSYAANGTNLTLHSIYTVATWQPTIVTVVMGALVIGILAGAFIWVTGRV